MSNTKPVIGILGLTRWSDVGMFKSNEYVDTSMANCMAIYKNGGIPMIIPAAVALDDPETAISACDGLLFPGGPDVNPFFYGEEPTEYMGKYESDKDEAWMAACRMAVQKKMPVLGCCRGIQLINVALGGSLYQDVKLQGEGILKHLQTFDRTALTQHVDVAEGTYLAGMLGAGRHTVNSIHHQCVKVPGEGLRISARCVDGTIEGIESEDGLVIGVQWHPEDLTVSSPENNQIFRYLVEKAKEYQEK